MARGRRIAEGIAVELSDVISDERIDARLAHIIAAKHKGLHEEALIGKAFESLFRELCGQQAPLIPTGEQILAPFAFVSNLAGALLALELARFDSGRRFEDGKNYLFISPWSPPYSFVRRTRPRLPECGFCARPATPEALESVWPVMKAG